MTPPFVSGGTPKNRRSIKVVQKQIAHKQPREGEREREREKGHMDKYVPKHTRTYLQRHVASCCSKQKAGDTHTNHRRTTSDKRDNKRTFMYRLYMAGLMSCPLATK